MNLFLQACGIENDFRLHVEDRQRSESHQMVFQRPYVMIGRTSDSDLTLEHWQVSRRHAYLQVVDGRLFCLDLGSRTGTHWEGPPSRWRWLGPRQAIHIGPYRIWSESLGADMGSESGEIDFSAPRAENLPAVMLESVNTPNEPWRLLDALTLIGRSPMCQIRLSDPTLSKFHAGLIRTPLGIWIVDLFGTGGISINQTRLRSARLNEGDEISVGQHRLRLQYLKPNAYPILFDEDRIEPSGTTLAKFASPANEYGLPASITPPGAPAMNFSAGTGFVMEGTTNPNLPESVMIAQALLGPMLNQFAMMQQQMFEQFHQSMMMMMQSMHMMHRERMDSVDKELAEVRRMTQELHSLQAEAARLKAAEAAPPVAPQPSVTPPPEAPRSGSSGQQAAGPHPNFSAQPRRQPIPPSQRPAQPQSASKPAPPRRPPPRAASSDEASEAKPAQPRPQADVHSILQQRITNLQNERQSRWQKILSMVGGGGGESR